MNNKIIDNLKLLSEKEKSNYFKHRAYEKAIEQLLQYPDEIKSIEDVENIPGIGKGIKEKIQQILNDTFKKPAINIKNEIFEQLKKIYGVGEKKALDLIENHNIKELSDLKQREAELLNEKQRIGLKYYGYLLERISQKEMMLHDKLISGIWKNDPHCNNFKFTYEIVGSYRRKEQTSGDIDILITFDESLNLLPRLIYTLRRNNYVIETLAEGSKKFMGIARIPNHTPRRIDIMWTSSDEYPFALFYFTGSDRYNRSVREIANKRGYRLNERMLIPITNLTKSQPLPEIRSERDITDFLGLPYLEPQERKN